jgi:hypothetical protein
MSSTFRTNFDRSGHYSNRRGLSHNPKPVVATRIQSWETLEAPRQLDALHVLLTSESGSV